MQEYTPTPDFYNDYIAHHGILGMKWGKKNGPPYPLGSSISTGHRLKKSSGSINKKNKTTTYKDSDGNTWKISGTPSKETQKRMAEYESKNKKRRPDRHERAANASARDAADLRRHGYIKEADAVQKVSDQQRAKSKTSELNSKKEMPVETNTNGTQEAKKNKTRATAVKALSRAGDFSKSDVAKFEKDLFLKDPEISPKIKKAKQLKDSLSLIEDETLGESSKYYNDGFKEYAKKNGNTESSRYGFSHYEWKKGNPHYDAAYKEYTSRSKSAMNEYNKCKNEIVDLMTSSLGKAGESQKMKDFASIEVSQFIQYKYDKYAKKG